MVGSGTRGLGSGLFQVALLFLSAIAWAIPAETYGGGGDPRVSVPIPVGECKISDCEMGQEICVEGFGRLLIPGKPNLPAKIFAIAIPPGAKVLSVSYEAGEGVELPGRYTIPPAPLPRVIGEEDAELYAVHRAKYEANHEAVYGSDEAYPPQAVEFVRTANYRGYDLVDVRVTPFAYHPLSRRLIHYPELTVHVEYTAPTAPAGAVVDGSRAVTRVADEIIVNDEQAASWYSRDTSESRGLHDFVIITTDALVSSITPLVDWETFKGRNVEVVTTSWIDSAYGGYDLAAKMRNFLREKYPVGEWGIQDVLLVGGYDSVPMRRTAQDIGYGRPETDFYYAELSYSDEQSWDADGDRNYGEDSDPIDFYAEVNVGRIPWDNADAVLSICEKSAAYEGNDDPAFKQNILLLGSFFWADTDNAVLMEAKVNQPWMGDWTTTRMYEKNSTAWSSYACDLPLTHANVMADWPDGRYAFVNWAGHGSPTSCHIMGLGSAAFIDGSDCPALSNDYPAIIFADACSNSDTDYTNIGKLMLRNGAVGFVGATKVALGCPGWDSPSDGSSQSLDYYFTTNVTSAQHTQGAALQAALREMYTQGLWGYTRYEMFEWSSLWGNPDLGMGPLPLLEIQPADGLPEYILPGEPVTITVQIREFTDAYVSDSATLHYRYNGGEYQTSPLVHAGGDLYEATLPAPSCADTPEYYFSAEGVQAGVVYSPADAPATVYDALVGEVAVLFADDFETDQGWTAVNLGATSGDWQRGVPVNDPAWDYDPIADSDGSGQCYLTQNELGNTDVDDGAVRLISPTLDLSAGNVTISYDFFLRLTDTGGHVDRILVEIDGNDGAGPWTEINQHAADGGLSWRHRVITQADLDAAGVTLTPTMKIRFTTNDADPQSINESGLDAFLITTFVCDEDDCFGDLDGDGDVDLADLSALLAHYGETSGMTYEDGDLDEDGDVDLSDLSALLSVYGTTCP